MPQPFVTPPYTPIVGTLGYVLSPDGTRVLMVRRDARRDDNHFGKYNGLGGKLEPNEDVAACMVRELREEAAIDARRMSLRGTINWTNFGPKGEDWLCFIFLVTEFDGTPPSANKEGRLEWVAVPEMDRLPMWEGDRFFLPLVFDGDPRPFHGYMPYDHEKPIGWNYARF